MRIWIHSTVKTAGIAPSTVFSIAVHVVLTGAAVYGTGVSARRLAEEISQRIYYLPPPDRRAASENLVEHLQYIDVGKPAPVTTRSPEGELVPPGGRELTETVGADAGKELTMQPSSIANDSQDSVYSVLDVEETAARTAGSAAPAYPPELMKQGKEGGVFLRFVVDTSGHADPASIEVIRTSHALFTEAVKTAVPLMLFSPATVGGRRVRQAVEQNFEFRIQPSTPAEHTKTKPVP